MKVGNLKNEAGEQFLTEVAEATQSASGLMSAADKVKLDNVENTYLPLSGGNMTGEIQRSGIGMANRTAGQFLAFYGGVTGTEGAALFLEDKAHETFPGSFILRAANGEQTRDLIGYPDGRLKFGSKFVFPTETFGLNAYFQLPGGTTVQGGSVSDIEADGTVRLTYPVAFKSTVYTVVANVASGTVSAGGATVNTGAHDKTGFSFILKNHPGGGTVRLYWLAIGY